MPQFSDDLFLGPATTYMGTGIRPYSTTFTGTISTTTLTVTALLTGAPIVLGMYVDGASVTDGSYVTAFGTGTGGTGTYTLSASSTVASPITMTAHTTNNLMRGRRPSINCSQRNPPYLLIDKYVRQEFF